MNAKLSFKFVIGGRAYAIEGEISLLHYEYAPPEIWGEIGILIGGAVAEGIKTAENPEMQLVPQGTTLQ